ncbi:MAG: cellulase family glycosylhydrolase [Planctomycetes bacterium]|nr:cellulase family glycosylhydrolase [Planctomycetota bacterium]MBL7144632.1 cellulase family glycosylhydrolase [Phycisphaerae bacterium]
MFNKVSIIKSMTVVPLILCICLTETTVANSTTSMHNKAEDFNVGVCTHFSQGKGILEMNIKSMKNAGIGAIRDEATWSSIERQKGIFVMPERHNKYVRSASEAGLDVMLILDYANRFYDDGDRPRSSEAIEGFCRYAEFVVRHFGKDVRLYEIWNEWDIGIGLPKKYDKGGSPEDYIKLLKAVYPRIKAAEPDTIVIAGGCTSGAVNKGWFENIIRLGALDYSDAVSIHSYNYSAGFPERSPETCSAWMTNVQNMLRKYNKGKDVPFYVTEMGWPTHIGKRSTTPQLSASYLARLYLLARTSPSFRGLWWYDFQDDGWKAEYNENNFGIVRPDLTPKPHYYVMADISDLITRGEYIDRLQTKDDNLYVLRFKHKQCDFWALWSSDDKTRQVILQTQSPSAPLTIHQLGHKPYQSSWGFLDWAGRKGELISDRLSIVIGPRPFLISGDLTNVSVLQTIPRPFERDYMFE